MEMKKFEDLEIWDYVPFNYNYKVSSKGQVWSSKSNKLLKFTKDRCGYYRLDLFEDGKRKNCRIHRLVALTFYFVEGENLHVDHIDRNKLNNNLQNLRFCTDSENCRNRNVISNNTSGFKGVSWDKRRKKWISRIQITGKSKYLGQFNTKEEAYEAYKKASKEFHGDFGYAP